MKKIKTKYLLILFLICLLSLSGCGGECKVNSDCPAKKCFETKCEDKKCVQNKMDNCCGNRKCEEPKETKCNCAVDCGKCEGKGKIRVGSGSREVEAKYLEYLCKDDDCIFSVDENVVKQTKLEDEPSLSSFKLGTVATFNNPFDLNNDYFNFKITLKDVDDDLVLPVKINRIVLKQGEVLFGELDLTGKLLAAVGDKIEVSVPSSYQPENIEEEKRITYKIEYQYSKSVKDQRIGNDWTYKVENFRDDYEKRFTTKVFLLNTG